MSDDPITLRKYATKENISLGTAYRRVWEGKVNAKQILGRWVIEPAQTERKAESKEAVAV